MPVSARDGGPEAVRLALHLFQQARVVRGQRVGGIGVGGANEQILGARPLRRIADAGAVVVDVALEGAGGHDHRVAIGVGPDPGSAGGKVDKAATRGLARLAEGHFDPVGVVRCGHREGGGEYQRQGGGEPGESGGQLLQAAGREEVDERQQRNQQAQFGPAAGPIERDEGPVAEDREENQLIEPEQLQRGGGVPAQNTQ